MKTINIIKLQPIFLLLLLILLLIVFIDIANTISTLNNQPVIVIINDKPVFEQQYLSKLIITQRYALAAQGITILTIISCVSYYAIKQITNSKPQ